MSVRRLVPVVLAGLACTDPITEPPPIPQGIVNLFVSQAPEGGYQLQADATFFLAPSGAYPDSRATVDTCQEGPYAPPFVVGGAQSIGAGDSLIMTVDGQEVYLKPFLTQANRVRYVSSPVVVPITAAAVVQVRVPGVGGGFPAATVSIATPAPVTTLSPIPAEPSTEEPLAVSWAPGGDATSRFELSLQYVPAGTSTFSRHVLCSWRDDGTGQIRPTEFGTWRTAAQRRIELTRFRTHLEQVGEGVLYVLATFDGTAEPAP